LKEVVVAIIQARMGSTRLPGKVLMKLSGRTILEILIERLKKAQGFSNIIVATSDHYKDQPIIDTARNLGVDAFAGSEEDVLGRFYRAAVAYDAQIVVRITADNPLTDLSLLNLLLEERALQSLDYIRPDDVILGIGSEVFTFESLEIAWKNSTKPYEREHVTPYIYENPSRFRIAMLSPPLKLARKDVRLTIDTSDDLKLFTHLANHFGDLVNVEMDDVLRFLDMNPSIKNTNINVKQKHYREF
jgi:spore coat polysaccharide biosynthesis protein SpsF